MDPQGCADGSVLWVGTPSNYQLFLNVNGLSDIVVSNADLRHTFDHLLRRETRVAARAARIRTAPVSETFFSVYLGTSIPVEELRHALRGAHHTWVFPTHHGVPDPFQESFHAGVPMEISAPILHDSTLAQQGSCLVLQAFSYSDWMGGWRVGPDGKRRRPYGVLKRIVEDQLIANADRVIPRLSERITYRLSSSPLTMRRYTLNHEGASAGWTWNPRRTLVRLTEQGITTPIEDLFCAGHWTLYPGGLLTATLAGKIAADIGLATLGGRVSADRYTKAAAPAQLTM